MFKIAFRIWCLLQKILILPLKTGKLVDLTDNRIRFFLCALFSFPKDRSATIYNLATV